MAKSPIVNFYHQALIDLKKLGVVSYPGNVELTRGQKGWITKKANEYAQVMRRPDDFHIAKVSKATGKELKASGFKVTKTGKAVIPLRSAESIGAKYDSAKISKGKIIFKSGNITETVTPSSAKNFHAKLKILASKPLKNNQMLTVKIGNNASFNSRFQSYADLYKYITEKFNPKPGKNGKKIKGRDLMRHMSIVEVSTPVKAKNGFVPDRSAARAKTSKEKNTKQNLTRK